MEQDKSTDKLASASRRKRIKSIKITIIVVVIVCLILPTIISIFLFLKVNSLQKQIDVLMIERYGVTYNELIDDKNKDVAHAAVINGYEKVLQDSNKDSVDITDRKAGTLEETNPISDDAAAAITSNESDKLWNQLDFHIDKEAMKSKEVYLTFDDGPSKYTGEILDILAEYNVKATFFVIGKMDEYSMSMYQRIVDEGHSLGIHSFSHVYNTIYNSLEDFEKDFTKLSNLLYDTTGYIPNIYRFPGGSGNDVSNVKISSIIRYLNKNNIVYFDWNVVNGDATGDILTPYELYYNVIKGVKIHNKSIVLMHDTDTKENTVKSLKYILQTLTELETEILPLDNTVSPIQQIKAK